MKKEPAPDSGSGKPTGRLLAFPKKGDGKQTFFDDQWASELAHIADEPIGTKCRLSLGKQEGVRLVGFLNDTGLDGMVLISSEQERMNIIADRETVTRLVVWQALDMGLSFTVDFGD